MMPTISTARSSAGDTPLSLTYLASKLPANRRRDVEHSYLRVYRQLMSADWPRSQSRTHVLPLGAEPAGAHAVSIGLLAHNDNGGIRLSSSFADWSALARDINLLLATLMEVCDLPQVSWTALQLNKDCASRMRVDSCNVGESLVLAIGNWTEGGRLWVADSAGREALEVPDALRGTPHRRGDWLLGSYHDIRWPLVFRGDRTHATEDYSGGARYSILAFSQVDDCSAAGA